MFSFYLGLPHVTLSDFLLLLLSFRPMVLLVAGRGMVVLRGERRKRRRRWRSARDTDSPAPLSQDSSLGEPEEELEGEEGGTTLT